MLKNAIDFHSFQLWRLNRNCICNGNKLIRIFMTAMFYCYFLHYSTMNKTLFERKKCRNELLTALFERVSKNFATWTYFVIQKLVKDTLSKRYFNIIYVTTFKALDMIFIDSKVLPSNSIICMNMKVIMEF